MSGVDSAVGKLRVDGQVALVTGASSGIGASVAGLTSVSEAPRRKTSAMMVAIVARRIHGVLGRQRHPTR